jgi:hypothetical protein
MKGTKYSEPQIFVILRQTEGGVPISEQCRKHGMSNASFYKWRLIYDSKNASMINQMKALFSKRLFQKIIPHAHLSIHPLETTVLLAHVLHLGDQVRIHTAKLGTPLVKTCAAHTMVTAPFRYRRTEVFPLFRTN